MAITRRAGNTVFVERHDALLGGTGIWEAALENSQWNALTDLGCTDYAAGVDSRRDRALGIRVSPQHHEMIVRTAREFCDPSDNSMPLPAHAKHYPDELRAAIEAFEAVHADLARLRGRSPKTVVAEWLETHKPELSASARDRIAVVANWQREGGAPKTPGK